jgi:hypothetical protein
MCLSLLSGGSAYTDLESWGDSVRGVGRARIKRVRLDSPSGYTRENEILQGDLQLTILNHRCVVLKGHFHHLHFCTVFSALGGHPIDLPRIEFRAEAVEPLGMRFHKCISLVLHFVQSKSKVVDNGIIYRNYLLLISLREK